MINKSNQLIIDDHLRILDTAHRSIRSPHYYLAQRNIFQPKSLCTLGWNKWMTLSTIKKNKQGLIIKITCIGYHNIVAIGLFSIQGVYSTCPSPCLHILIWKISCNMTHFITSQTLQNSTSIFPKMSFLADIALRRLSRSCSLRLLPFDGELMGFN